jgi:hypothetical protein
LIIKALNPKREREIVRKDSRRVGVKRGRKRESHSIREERKSILLEGIQAMPARLSDNHR